MASLDLKTVEEKLCIVATFLQPCLSLANAHATDFITQQYWDKFLPKPIQDELLGLNREQLSALPSSIATCSLEQCSGESTEQKAKGGLEHDLMVDKNDEKEVTDCFGIGCHSNCEPQHHCKQINKNIIYGENGKSANCCCAVGCKDKLQYSSIDSFCSTAATCTLDRLGLAVTPDILSKHFDASQNELFIGTFMSEKKSHEVEVMSKVCASIVNGTDCKLVIDFGSGKGYLGKHLSLQYKIPVLGIDSVDKNTQSADQRSAVLDKQWQALTRNAANELSGKKLSRKERKLTKNAVKADRLENSETNTYAKRYSGNNLSDSMTNSVMDDNAMYDTKGNNLTGKSDLELCTFATCTCYIDSNTDFMELARRKFSYLFSSSRNNTKESDNDRNNELTKCSNTSRSNVEDKCDFDGSQCLSCNHGNASNKPSCIETDMKKDTSCDKSNGKSGNKLSISAEGLPSDDRSHCTNVQPPSIESLSLDTEPTNYGNTKIDNIKTMLVGLHTCGDLASTSVDLFTRNNQLNVLCNVGCCYNLMTEKYLDDDDGKETVTNVGFPLCRRLNQLKFSIGNTARNLACQSVYRVPQFEQLQGERFYPRALLEVIIEDTCKGGDVVVNKKGLRGLEKKCKSTKEYLKKACDKLNISDKITDDIIDEYLIKYKYERHQLAAFFQLKTILAPCIETLIMLDRIAFLLEQGDINEVYLVQMFDPVISPRCYAIVGLKT
ncbi:Methyltransferase-like protein 25 [Mactra antiquata]